jgi:mannose/cellobiose epimerase-like protein (N-acyl-D-glucosamine 2-epimerase family)
MTNRRNYGVMVAEADDLERCAEFVALTAAARVAAGDASPADAIKEATEYLAKSREADGAPTGTLEVENKFPEPSKKMPVEHVQEVADKLLDAAREAVEDI